MHEYIYAENENRKHLHIFYNEENKKDEARIM